MIINNNNNFDEIDFYRLLASILKADFNTRIIDNKILSEFCTGCNLDKIYNHVSYRVNENYEITRVDFSTALFVLSSIGFIFPVESYESSHSFITKNVEECVFNIQKYGEEKYKAIYPIAAKLVELQQEIEEELDNNIKK